MKYVILAAILALALATFQHQEGVEDKHVELFFRKWMTQHHKNYTGAEYTNRLSIFKANNEFIRQHNSKRKHAHEMFMGHNEFSDLNREEFKAYRMKVRDFAANPRKNSARALSERAVTNPTSVDWRTKGAVTGIKNQGQCGSCWSFSATGSMEGQHFLKKGVLVAMSEKNLMDCSWDEGDDGCSGGLMDNAFQYVIQNGGIDTESSYPYNPVSSHNCKFSASNEVPNSGIQSYHDISSGSESGLETAVAGQPTSVAIDASQPSFQFYSGGVYYEPACSSSQLDHGVLAVGYGTSSGQAYWLVKNSWGTSWGLQGYIMMSKDRNNNCGIATAASYPEY